MKYIFVDFEMNPVNRKFSDIKKRCPREIIEIGAIMLNENFEEVSSYKTFVRPEFNDAIQIKCQELTRISFGMIQGAIKFEKALGDFVEWCGDEYKIYAWSNSDKNQILKEINAKSVSTNEKIEYMLNNWIDFQKIFGEIVNAEHLISLEKALNMCGIPFSGRKHDALIDARNTSLLFAESMVSDISKSIDTIKNLVTKETENKFTTMGDMFNFASLGFQYA